MSSTGDVSSCSQVRSSGYEASDSGSSLACTSLRRSLVMSRAPHLEVQLKIGGLTKRSVIIDTPEGIREKMASFVDEFLAEYDARMPVQDHSVDSELDFQPNTQLLPAHTTSTPNIVRPQGQCKDYSPLVFTHLSSSDPDVLKSTPVLLVPDTDQSSHQAMELDENEHRAPLAPPRKSSEYRMPLAQLQEVAEEIVSEDSLSQSFQECTKLNSSYEPASLACSLDITKARIKKTLPHAIQATPTEKIHPNPGIFEGYRFCLTYDIDHSLHNSFSKDVTQEQIEAGGGEVLKDLQRGDDPCNTVLISDFSSSTKNYLMALVLGVPCVTYIYIEDCCRLNRKADLVNLDPKYYLDRGTNVLTKHVVPHNPTACTEPFQDYNIYLQGSKNFKSLWADIIRVGGGTCRPQLNKNYKPDIVVTNKRKGFSTNLRNVISDYALPVVPVEWLLQTVILGELQDTGTFSALLDN